MITHCIQHSNYKEALKILTEKAAQILKLPEKELRNRFKPFAELFYKFSPALVKRCAGDTVNAWIRMGPHLEPHKLIPALIQCNQPVDSAQVCKKPYVASLTWGLSSSQNVTSFMKPKCWDQAVSVARF